MGAAFCNDTASCGTLLSDAFNPAVACITLSNKLSFVLMKSIKKDQLVHLEWVF